MKIAILKLSAMGDIIQSAFILQFLKQHISNIDIDWIVEEGFKDILKHNPDITNIKTVNLKSIKKSPLNIFRQIRLLKEYSKENYDVIIDLQGLIKSAISGKILSSNLYGYDKNSVREKAAALLYKKDFNIPYHINTIDRYRLLINQAFNIDITKGDILNKKPYISYSSDDKRQIDQYISKDRKNILFIIGASWDSKIYPKEKVANVIKEIDANIIVPYSNDKEFEFVSYLKDVTPVKLNINQLSALISIVDLVIGNDTGPTYIAWANNIPSITLFGPVPPTRIYETDINKLLKSPSKVDPYKLNREDYSIQYIKEEDILKLVKELL